MKTPTHALFAGKDDAAAGGWNDIVMLGSLEECRARLQTWHDDAGTGVERGFDWAHIVDLQEGEIALVATAIGNEVDVVWMPTN